MSTAHLVRGNALTLPFRDDSVDLIVTSPPYFALRSYKDEGEHYADQVGGEETPEDFLTSLWYATEEMKRVLKPTGSIFVNLGDKYTGSGGNNQSGIGGEKRGPKQYNKKGVGRPKSLMGLPWRYAIGCIDHLDLILRAEIIWSKSNGLPESVKDRVRRSHEQWFHFVKEPHYYSAIDEIREPHKTPPEKRVRPNARRVKTDETEASVNLGGRRLPPEPGQEGAFNSLGKLVGSVWTIPIEPLNAPKNLGVEHFAAFPTEWPRKFVLGFSPPGVCVECGEGRRPIVKKGKPVLRAWSGKGNEYRGGDQNSKTLKHAVPRSIVGYGCACTPTDADLDTCDLCGCLVPLRNGTRTTAMPAMRKSDNGQPSQGQAQSSAGAEEQPLLFEEVRERDDGGESSEHQGVRDDDQGIQSAADAGSSDGGQDGVSLGASVRNVADDRPAAEGQRSGPSLERDQGRQPTGEPDSDDQIGTRPDERSNQKTPDHLSILRSRSAVNGGCPGCGSPPTKPSVILDPFGGTGTVAMVAKAHGRTGISLDLSTDYLKLARWRIFESGGAEKSVGKTRKERQARLL